jgi:hypothetical protein
MGNYARGGARGDCWSTTGAAGIATSSLEGAGDVDGDQKSASIGVCASITTNIGAAVTAEKAKIAMQTMMTVAEREVTPVILSRRIRELRTAVETMCSNDPADSPRTTGTCADRRGRP